MNTTLRPYTKYITVGATETSSIQFKDTAGSSLPCNYIRVTTSGTAAATDDNDFTVYLSSINGLTNPDTPIGVGTLDGSGFCGVHGQGDGINPVEIFLDDQDRVSSIQIYSLVEKTFAITYGNIRVSNSLRLNDRSKGS